MTAGNTGDAAAAGELLAGEVSDAGNTAEQAGGGQDVQAGTAQAPLAAYGDAAYGAGELLEKLEQAAPTS